MSILDSDLRKINGQKTSAVHVDGYYKSADSGGGDFTLFPNDSTAPDKGLADSLNHEFGSSLGGRSTAYVLPKPSIESGNDGRCLLCKTNEKRSVRTGQGELADRR